MIVQGCIPKITIRKSTPTTPWQAWKKAYLPGWVLKVWPVKYTVTVETFDITTYATEFMMPRCPVRDDKLRPL